MIEPTDEMFQALLGRTANRGLEALLAIIERDYLVRSRSTLCDAEHPRGPYVCEFPAGHTGMHLTWSGPVLQWEPS